MDIKISKLTKAFENEKVFDDFDINFDSSLVTAVMGTSGVGKSTLLNCIANLTDYSGNIYGNNCNISYIFQDDALIEHMSVRKNLEYVILDNPDKCKIAIEMLELCGILDKADCLPNELSGGQRQRVTIARAFIYPSQLMLLDEAFNSLDISLKFNLMNLFKRLLEKQTDKTVLFVTHDIDEAIFLSDKIVVLHRNKIAKTLTLNSNKFSRQPTDPDCQNVRNELYKLLTNI